MNPLWKKAPTSTLTTGIGSLPHAHLDAALEFSFRCSIPFLPQLPIRNPREFMLVQAIDGLPGLIPEDGGSAKLDEQRWSAGRQSLRAKTEKAFSEPASAIDAFAAFEPSPEVWSCWNPFLWELREREFSFAKIQLAGPLTCQWSLQTTEGKAADRNPELSMQVFRLILARAVAMCRKLHSIKVVPLFVLDEPGFFAFSKSNPRHMMALQELKLFIRSLQKEQALVGMHCCSNTDWKSVLSLPLDLLSIDTHLSLLSVLSEESVDAFFENGGRLALGAVPTGVHSLKIHAFTPALLAESLEHSIDLAGKAPLKEKLFSESIFTPACGLALHSVEDSDRILDHTLSLAEQARATAQRTLAH